MEMSGRGDEIGIEWEEKWKIRERGSKEGRKEGAG